MLSANQPTRRATSQPVLATRVEFTTSPDQAAGALTPVISKLCEVRFESTR